MGFSTLAGVSLVALLSRGPAEGGLKPLEILGSCREQMRQGIDPDI